MMTAVNKILVITCGAIAREVNAIRKLGGWDQVDLQALPAELHSTPQFIAQAVADKIDAACDHYDHIFVAYGDCGTSGRLDRVLAERKVARLSGAHCYEFLAGADRFNHLQEEEPGTFYLTDFLARHFDRLVIAMLGIDRFPELLPTYFSNYTRLVYLAQTNSSELDDMARGAAQRLGLRYQRILTGTGSMQPNLDRAMQEALCPV